MQSRMLASMFAALLLAQPTGLYASVDDGVQKYQKGDFKGAVTEWEPLAATGDANASFNLGQAYRLGRGVKQDLSRAVSFYESAAKLGHVTAQGNLGTLYYFSQPPVQNRKKAVEWWHTAAQNGDARAQYMLGVLYFNGDDVAKDWAKAYAYTSLARDGGLAEAKTAFVQMSKHLKPDDISEGDRQKSHLIAARNALANSKPPVLADSGTGKPVVNWTTASEARPSVSGPAPVSTMATPAALPDSGTVERNDLPTVFNGLPTGSAGPAAAPSAKPVVITPKPPVDMPKPVASSPPAMAAASAPVATPGGWKIQLGAFGTADAAQRAWLLFQGKADGALTGATMATEPAGAATRLLAAGFGNRARAESVCQALKAKSIACFVRN